MRAKGPLTIQTALCLAIAVTLASTMLGAGALFEYQLHRSRLAAHELHAASLAEVYAAQLIPVLQAGTGKEVATFVEQVRWPKGVRFMAVIDADGRLLAVRGEDSILKQYLDLPPDLRPVHRSTFLSMADPIGKSSSGLVLAAMPIRSSSPDSVLGTALCAVTTPAGTPFTTRQSWHFFAGLAVVATAGFLLGSMYLHRNVVRPLLLLSRRAGKAGSPNIPANLPSHLPGEIGELAKTLADLEMDLEQWRERSDRLQHDFAARVQSETARITRELRRTERKAWTDPLTRLSNRRMLDDKLAEIFDTSTRAGDDLAVVMIDVDNFKPLNDTLGHKAGDDLLRFTGDLLRQSVREEDLAIRYGGDEFLLILPGASAGDARMIAERTVRLFAQQTRLIRIEPKPSMSAGIASFGAHHPSSPQHLLEMADAALYAAKDAGKSQVAVYHNGCTATRANERRRFSGTGGNA